MNRAWDVSDERHAVEKSMEWRDRWANEIPCLSFPEDWVIRVIPPFGGAIVRFVVKPDEYSDVSVSVYLDGYNALGVFTDDGQNPLPYWEVYPVDGGTRRCHMDDTEQLIDYIQQSLDEQTEG